MGIMVKFWCKCSASLVPSPNFHVTSPESGSGQQINRDFLGSAESACLKNATLNQITGLLQVTR